MQLPPKRSATFNKEFTRQEPIPEEAIERVVELLRTGRLHRYNTPHGDISEVSALESEFAEYVGARFCVGFSSCGSSLYVAMKCLGVQPGDRVLCNAFTLAPVPGAIKKIGAEPVFVEINKDYVIDLDDLERKARDSGSKYLLLSHMRGHIADLDAVVTLCRRYDIQVIEDCAHTMGAKWGDRYTGTFGRIGCFSTQTYKHINSGEGGLLVTDDEDVAAQAILYSGSYMFYGQHTSRPDVDVFQKYRDQIPNLSLRMSNLVAVLIRVQLLNLETQCERWNERYRRLESQLKRVPHIRVPNRSGMEAYVGSSFQFALEDVNTVSTQTFVDQCIARGIQLKWFGASDPAGYTSSYEHWKFFSGRHVLPQTQRILHYTCDFRIPLTFTLDDCDSIAAVIDEVSREVFSGEQ